MSNTVTLLHAVNEALAFSMTQDKSVVLLGQDVGVAGGVFRVTDGLLSKFGHDRVIDMPLSEALIAGSAVGMALSGLRPVVEFQFMGFSYTALDQIINHASRISTRTRGSKHCPIVYRMPFGNHIRAPEHHAESMESLFAHVPGIKLVSPSCAQSAYDLTIAAVQDNNPVVILEPLSQYHIKSTLDVSSSIYSLSKSHTLISGEDLTLISWGSMLSHCRRVTEQLIQQGASIELIDLVSLAPIDFTALIASVKKTGRCVIVQESCLHCSVATSLAAQLQNMIFPYLRGPIALVSAPDAVVPYYQNTDYFLPSVSDIRDSCLQALSN